MTSIHLSERAGVYFQRLCLDIPGRRVGSQGNRAATDFFARTIASLGFETDSPAFDCIDWTHEGVDLAAEGASFEAFVSPYSLGYGGRAPLVVATSIEELEAVEVADEIIMLRGEIAKEPLMPKNFPFYNPDEHRRIIQILEEKRPQAIIAATSRNPDKAGALYPFPLIEDGDFDIPSAYVTEEEGINLAHYAGKEITLDIRANRSPSRGCNVIARKGADWKRRFVLFAHIDAKDGTPGAIDNASGVITLLLLAELLGEYADSPGVEIVAMNGEDYYNAPGEQLYLSSNAGKFEEIILGINLDGVGYIHGNSAYSLYGCPPDIAGLIHKVFSVHHDIVEGGPWYQGDHGLFLLNHRPALAITSERVGEIMANIVHTPADRPEIVDSAKLATLALGLRDLLFHLDQALAQR